MDKWISTGKQFGLEGKDLLECVKEQQEIEWSKANGEREERRRNSQQTLAINIMWESIRCQIHGKLIKLRILNHRLNATK